MHVKGKEMTYYAQLEAAGRNLLPKERCAFCQQAIPGIVERLKTLREPEGGDMLDAITDIKDELMKRHYSHGKSPVGLSGKRKINHRFTRTMGRRPPRR